MALHWQWLSVNDSIFFLFLFLFILLFLPRESNHHHHNTKHTHTLIIINQPFFCFFYLLIRKSFSNNRFQSTCHSFETNKQKNLWDQLFPSLSQSWPQSTILISNFYLDKSDLLNNNLINLRAIQSTSNLYNQYLATVHLHLSL